MKGTIIAGCKIAILTGTIKSNKIQIQKLKYVIMISFHEWLSLKESNNPVEREEFLRDVIAVIQGNPSPEFSADQKAVQAEVQRILSMIPANDPKAKRILLKQLELQWQNAKSLSDAWSSRKVASSTTTHHF